ncbi:MAG: phosphoribosylformylglycinamidine synthase subunit PurQ [Deltaproteobacteria bacterium]|nr:phosphoribosylformylglycinamidine synthase subunit PurQ [Deltaproteobacteria bacterium]
MKFGILVFPGSNCDWDCYHVITKVLKQKAQFVWHKESRLPAVDVVIVPGGFSYGDYLRTGAIARFSPIMKEVIPFAKRGGKVLGICNGFQILTEAGLLPGVLMRNKNLKFICETVSLKVEKTREVIRMPIAHGEGNYFADEETLNRLEGQGHVLLRYHPINPNGSQRNIAGIRNVQGNVMGMMPHPERCAEAALGNEDGRKIFESLIG